ADTVLEQRARDHEALDLGGALVDLHDARIAVEAFDRVFLHVAVAAVDLDRLVGDPVRGLAGVELGHRRLARERTSAILEPRRALSTRRAVPASLNWTAWIWDRGVPKAWRTCA